ncbi:hypothetical protein OS493_026709 [Desmophyllum pertusum]|uniref:Uncharacterized protein n=1 Tax=Desmophyllum pertusum TaxID=174260 RepID=A0A9W9ZZS1_9CNID|nr:hypothetical protein OS493_026709 [Desmophyllum pertusum]
MKVLADARRKLGLEWQDPSNQMFAEKILNFQRHNTSTRTMFMGYFDCVKRLWRDNGNSRSVRQNEENFQLDKISEYFSPTFGACWSAGKCSFLQLDCSRLAATTI